MKSIRHSNGVLVLLWGLSACSGESSPGSESDAAQDGMGLDEVGEPDKPDGVHDLGMDDLVMPDNKPTVDLPVPDSAAEDIPREEMSGEDAISEDVALEDIALEDTAADAPVSDTMPQDMGSDAADVLPQEDISLADVEEPPFQEFSNGGITFLWRIEGENLRMAVESTTTGWVAVGFEPSLAMKDANFLIGYVAANGTVSMRDDYGVSTSVHSSDLGLGGTEDISEISGIEEAGVTRIECVIPLDSGDAFDKPLEAGQQVFIILGAGPAGADNFTTKHSKLGMGTITL